MERDLEPQGEARAELGRHTWADVAASGEPVVLVPLGSCEQHGPHLPLDTDTRIAQAVARSLAARRDDVVVAPAIAYGSSGEHQAFPGTLSIGTDVLTTMLVELGRSAFAGPGASSPYRAMVLVNGHGGNAEALHRAVEILGREDRPVRWWAPRIAGGDAHAGRTETSLLLAIDPDVVGTQRPVGEVRPIGELLDDLRAGAVAAVSDDGVLGDATGASAVEGNRLLRALVDDLDLRVDEALARS